MRLLLDSHSLIWWILGDTRLSPAAKSLIADPSNEILISPAVYWEIAIKEQIGKLALHQPYEDFLDLCFNKYGFSIIPIEPRHAVALLSLPIHHKDPFDRMLVAQAVSDSLGIVSADKQLDAYGVPRHW